MYKQLTTDYFLSRKQRMMLGAGARLKVQRALATLAHVPASSCRKASCASPRISPWPPSAPHIRASERRRPKSVVLNRQWYAFIKTEYVPLCTFTFTFIYMKTRAWSEIRKKTIKRLLSREIMRGERTCSKNSPSSLGLRLTTDSMSPWKTRKLRALTRMPVFCKSGCHIEQVKLIVWRRFGKKGEKRRKETHCRQTHRGS